jgi:ABC-type oligopeptide transport system ATPase subunit
MTEPLLQVDGLTKEFVVRGGPRRRRAALLAVDDVSFTVAAGEALGLVGESGSGKSTTARCVMRLIEPTRGSIRFAGQDLRALRGGALRRVRRGMQMVFQDPYSSLDPRMRVQDIVAEGMLVHRTHPDAGRRRARVQELLELVGLRPDHLTRRPANFSGGERQRIGIARALALEPKLLICDEPVASLDVSIQAQILNLFKDLQAQLGLSIVYIAHDLATVRHLCDRIAVLRDGRIQEIGDREQIYTAPRSEYTRELIDAVPVPDPIRQREKQERNAQERRRRQATERDASAPADAHTAVPQGPVPEGVVNT